MRPFRLLALIVSLHAVPLGATAQESSTTAVPADMAQIEQAWQAGDFVAVRQGLEQLSQTSDAPLVQYRYGRVLLEGRGGTQDIDAAVGWLQKAVDQHHAEAAALLAKVYLTEFDTDVELKTKRSPERAADLLTFAATQGFAAGQYELARLYGAGLGVAKDDKAAFRWLLAAAQQQYVNAQFALALAYSKGIGVEQSTPQAIRWLTAAGENGNARAQVSLARAYETGNGVAQSMPQAMDWYRRAAEGGTAGAQRVLGTRLLFGAEGITPDAEKGLQWLLAAAKAGDDQAMALLARAHVTGTGLPQSDKEAVVWYQRAAQYDNGRAKAALAAMYETGRGVEVNFDEAVQLYQQALAIPDGNTAAARLGQLAADGALDGRFAPQRMVPWAMAALQEGSEAAETWLLDQAGSGLRAAQSSLAFQYLDTPDKAAKGAELLKLAAQAGDAEAGHRLGRLFMTGDQVPVDYVAAHQWFNIAATLGQTDAIELRTTVTALMTPDQIAQAQEGARDWLANGQPQPPATVQSVTEVSQDGRVSEDNN